MRFKLTDLPHALQDQVANQLYPSLARVLPDTQPKRVDRAESVGDEKAQRKGAAGVVVIITRCATRNLDRDNLWGGAKAACDGLRYSGRISGDTEQEIELFVFQKKVSKQNIGTLIEIIYQ